MVTNTKITGERTDLEGLPLLLYYCDKKHDSALSNGRVHLIAFYSSCTINTKESDKTCISQGGREGERKYIPDDRGEKKAMLWRVGSVKEAVY